MEEKIVNVEKKISELDEKISQVTKLNLVGQEIIHKKYGKGVVVKQDLNSLEIKFAKDAIKTFCIDALVSKKLLKAVEEDLQKKIEYIN